ncbi:MAG: ABC transporter permease [Chloroflexi bacterium]|nr:ABC transporter permease [Chloroflexota bacterium]
MLPYIGQRVFLAIPSLLGVSLLIFLALRVLPGDVALIMLVQDGGPNAATPENLARVRQQLGTDRPLAVQYVNWLTGLVQLDPGNSFRSGRSFPITLELTLLATLFALILGVPAGVISATRQDTTLDYIVRVISMGGIAMPVFWTGTLMLLAMVQVFHWLPPLGYTGFFADPWRNIQQVAWPALALGYYMAALVGRMTRVSVLEVIREDYVRTARAKGLHERAVLYGHALKNAALPILTVTTVYFGHLLGGTVVIETVFNLPGMGLLLIDSIARRDYPITQAVIVFIALLTVAINLIVDLTYSWLDPRIRYS